MQTFHLFCTKNYFFYFTHQFLQNTHISLSILHIYSIKYSFFYNFLLFPHLLPLSLTYLTLPKNTKILNVRDTVIVHIYMVIVALVHLCTVLHHWCGCFLGQNMHTSTLFLFYTILHLQLINYTSNPDDFWLRFQTFERRNPPTHTSVCNALKFAPLTPNIQLFFYHLFSVHYLLTLCTNVLTNWLTLHA